MAGAIADLEQYGAAQPQERNWNVLQIIETAGDGTTTAHPLRFATRIELVSDQPG
jgi:hypothetical protein